MFIGTHEIKETEQDGEFVKIIFDDGLDLRIKQELLEAIQTEEKAEGSYVEVISFHFARKLLADLALNELPCSYAEIIPAYVSNLTENLTNELIDRTFGCHGGKRFIPMNTLVK